MPLPSIKAAVDKIIGHRRPNKLASCPNMGCDPALIVY